MAGPLWVGFAKDDCALARAIVDYRFSERHTTQVHCGFTDTFTHTQGVGPFRSERQIPFIAITSPEAKDIPGVALSQGNAVALDNGFRCPLLNVVRSSSFQQVAATRFEIELSNAHLQPQLDRFPFRIGYQNRIRTWIDWRQLKACT